MSPRDDPSGIDPGIPSTGQEMRSAAICVDCGHSKSLHWMHFGGPGSCSATVDTRHPAGGGDTLTPCKCKGYREGAFSRTLRENPLPTANAAKRSDDGWRDVGGVLMFALVLGLAVFGLVSIFARFA